MAFPPDSERFVASGVWTQHAFVSVAPKSFNQDIPQGAVALEDPVGVCTVVLAVGPQGHLLPGPASVSSSVNECLLYWAVVWSEEGTVREAELGRGPALQRSVCSGWRPSLADCVCHEPGACECSWTRACVCLPEQEVTITGNGSPGKPGHGSRDRGTF